MSKTTIEAEPAAAEPRLNKTAAVLELLRRPRGATLNDLTEATGWQLHTARAALTGLKKMGPAVERGKVNGTSRYHIPGACGR